MSENFKIIEEQEKVLNMFDSNIIISASAGSGKTSVLIRKISDYIENRQIDISNILALTYTNAAAEEMKERLMNSFTKCAEECAVDSEKREILAQQIDKLSTADVSTFHSFYERVIKKYFYVLGINPSFEILSNEDMLIIKNKAFEEAIGTLKEIDFEKYLNITDILGKKRKDNSIKERLFKLDEFLSSQLDRDKWLEETAVLMFKNKEKTFSALQKDIEEKIKFAILAFNQLLEGAKNEKIIEYLNKCCLSLNELNGDNFKDLYEKINKFSFPIFNTKEIEEEEVIQEIKDLRDSFSDSIKDYKKDYGDFENIENSFVSCEKNVNTLIDLYKNYKSILNKKKTEINKYEFSDLEDLCCELIKNEKIQKEIKEQYQLIFIDEFQDTNPIQYEIIKNISRGDNVFIVGDPKQSIYAFRQTDVDIFNSVYSQYSGLNLSALSLRSNFRSNKKILEFVDGVFDRLMTKELSGVDYKKDSRFIPMSSNSCENHAVTVSLVKKEKANKSKEEINSVYNIFNDIPEEEEVSLEAKLIANQIGRVLNEEIYDDKTKKQRKVEFNDITILMRNRSKLLKAVTEIFHTYNIPYLVNDKIDLLLSKEVALLISLLNLCNNVKDDLNLACVLASDFTGLDFNQLAQVRAEFAEEKFFYRCCEKYLEKNDEISSKLIKFNEFLNKLKFNIQFKGIGFALNSAVSEKKIAEKLMLKSSSEFKVEIMNQFIDYVEQSTFNRSLVGLLNFLNSSKEIYVSSVKKSSSDAINITTVHGSKGLEYPVVFLCDTGRNLGMTKPEMSDLKISKNWGMAIRNYNEKERKIYPSIFEKVIKIENEKKDLAENLRLLYVALTRAKNKIYISGEVEGEKKISCISSSFDLLNLRPQSFINYILGTFSKANIKELEDLKKFCKDGLMVQMIDDFNFEKGESFSKKTDLRKEKIKNYLNFNYKYPYSESVTLAQKTSVTEIVSNSHGQENVTAEPRRFDVSEYLKGSDTTAEKGTLIHEVLEKVDLSLSGEDLEKNIHEIITEVDNEHFEVGFLFSLIKNNVAKIKELIPKNSKVYKEKLFMLNASLNDIFGEGGVEKVLIQGKLDLICLGEKNIIIDYKFTSIKREEKLINKYKKQLIAYCFALEKALNIDVDQIYIFDVLDSKPIAVNK